MVDKYNNAYKYITIKMKYVNMKSIPYFDSSKENNDKILNLELVIFL